MIYLILLFTILFFILAWRRLDWAMMILIAALPAYLIRFNIFGLPATLLEAMIWAVFAVWAVKNFGQVKNNFLENFKENNWKIKVRYPLGREIILWLIAAFAAAGIAGFSASSLGIWKAYFFEPVLLFIAVINVIAKNPPLIPPLPGGQESSRPPFSRGVELVLWPLAISALAVSLLAVYQELTGALIDNPAWAAEGTRRVVSFFGYPNAVGLYLGPIVLVMTGWLFNIVKNFQFSIFNFQTIFNVKIFKLIFIALVIVLSVLSIYFAKSKGALLGVAAGLIVFGLMASKKIRWATVAVALIAAIGMLSFQPARQAALNTVSFKTLSGQIRLAGFKDSWSMLKDGRWLTGAGLNNYQAAVKPYHTEGIFIKDPNDPEAQRKLVYNAAYRTAHWQPLEIYLYPHNIFLNFWSELGLAGLSLFIWIIGKYFWLGIHVLSLRVRIRQLAETTKQSHEPGDRRLPRSPSSRLGSLAMTEKFLTIGLICAMAAIVVHGMVDVPYFKNDLAAMFWLLIAMMSMVSLENNYGKDL